MNELLAHSEWGVGWFVKKRKEKKEKTKARYRELEQWVKEIVVYKIKKDGGRGGEASRKKIIES